VPQITFNVPADVAGKLAAACRAELGDAAEGLSDTECGKAVAIAAWRGVLHRAARAAVAQSQAVTDAQGAVAAAETAAKDASEARAEAERVADAVADSDAAQIV